MPKQKKQFCPRGHDTFIEGRFQGRCNKCNKEDKRIRYYANIQAERKRSRDYRAFIRQEEKSTRNR